MNGFIRRWRFATERRWFTYFLMALIFAIACAFLSRWQFGRNAETVAAHTLLTNNYDAHPVAPSSLLPTMDSYVPKYEWRPVELVGHYLPSKQLLVINRVSSSDPGFEVLVPFRLTNGTTFIVDRGWVSIGQKQTAPDYVPPAPTGLEHVTARLQQTESLLPGRTAPKGEIPEINLDAVATMTHLAKSSTYTGSYGLLAHETPAPATRPIAAPKPTIDNGPFLSYAIQWILFAIMGFAGLGWALRNEYRIRNADDPVVIEHAAARKRKAELRDPTDAEIEDAQIADASQREAELEDANR